MTTTINGRTPQTIKKRIGCWNAFRQRKCPAAKDITFKEPGACKNCALRVQSYTVEQATVDILEYVEQLERERDAAVEAAKVKPFTWEEAIQDDCFLEIKDDEYIDAALNIFASSHDEFDEEDHISYLTNDTPEDEILILYRGDYNRKWRCWPRRPTDEERAAVKWEVE